MSIPRTPLIARTCQTCGKSFTRLRDQNDPDPNHGLYCSRVCSNLARNTHIERTCGICGKAFTCKPSDKKQYCSNACRGVARSGNDHPNWRGGKMVNAVSGYVYVLVGQHKYALEHRLVMEQHLGRPLTADEEVHHLDHNRQNNDVGNLQLISKTDHEQLHDLNGKWSYEYDCCTSCGRVDRPHSGSGLCHTCYQREYRRGMVGHTGPNHAKGRRRVTT